MTLSAQGEPERTSFWVWTQSETYAEYASAVSPEEAIASYAENRRIPYGTRIYAVPAEVATKLRVGMVDAA